MKLAQFKTKTENAQRLGLLAGDRVLDVSALAKAVQQGGGEVSGWLLEAFAMIDVISQTDETQAEIGKLVGDAESRGLTGDDRLAFALDAIEFLPAVYPGKILAIGR